MLRIRSVFFRIRIRVTQKRPDPTGSGSYLDMFLMFSKINNYLWHFYTIYINISWQLKSKIKKWFWRNCILGNFIFREIQGSFVDKGSGSGIFPDPGDPKRPDPDPDPDPQHCKWHIQSIWRQIVSLCALVKTQPGVDKRINRNQNQTALSYHISYTLNYPTSVIYKRLQLY